MSNGASNNGASVDSGGDATPQVVTGENAEYVDQRADTLLDAIMEYELRRRAKGARDRYINEPSPLFESNPILASLLDCLTNHFAKGIGLEFFTTDPGAPVPIIRLIEDLQKLDGKPVNEGIEASLKIKTLRYLGGKLIGRLRGERNTAQMEIERTQRNLSQRAVQQGRPITSHTDQPNAAGSRSYSNVLSGRATIGQADNPTPVQKVGSGQGHVAEMPEYVGIGQRSGTAPQESGLPGNQPYSSGGQNNYPPRNSIPQYGTTAQGYGGGAAFGGPPGYGTSNASGYSSGLSSIYGGDNASGYGGGYDFVAGTGQATIAPHIYTDMADRNYAVGGASYGGAGGVYGQPPQQFEPAYDQYQQPQHPSHHQRSSSF